MRDFHSDVIQPFNTARDAQDAFDRLSTAMCGGKHTSTPTDKKCQSRKLHKVCMIDTQTGHSEVFRSVNSLCEKMNWRHGGHLYKKIHSKELVHGKYLVVFVED